MNSVKIRHSAQLALVDERVNTVVKGLKPEQAVVIEAEMSDERGRIFTSRAFFDADANGVLDLDKTPTKLGSGYEGRDCMGLIFAMLPGKATRPGTRFVRQNVSEPNHIQITVLDGDTNRVLATSSFMQTYMAEGVRREVIHTKCGLRGTMFLPPGQGPHKGIIDMFGGGGGLFEFRAALFASRGFAAYALPYFHFEDLPARMNDVDFGYFRRALKYFCARAEVDDSEGVGVIGTSKGSQLAYLMASECEKVRAVVSVSGLHVLTVEDLTDGPERTIPALPIPFNSGGATYQSEYPAYSLVDCWSPVFDQHNEAVQRTTIRVEKSRAAILMISGSDDCDWPAARSAQATLERLQRCKYPYPYEHLCLMGAGHLIEPPYSPFTHFSYFAVLGGNMLWGGERMAHVQGERIAWRRTLEFFSTHLTQPLQVQLPPIHERQHPNGAKVMARL
mmetsp:Transcript_14776/g.37587  ORF Transcript_14776/g.37587 Transcript_14776/m.37587 type:complete len:448 (-) Transcript_14776:628-1971(-)|eukprot:CAMPEP_0177639774 /NCGR_PEP_ID=MMETSP0447-20121125/6198_1 /TAXON_ID=0 /ORGANISM="Stygamoeba regulata, Strain BSH-02190019" /LENGTH=447 /DNA_ID=CAMNT_0019141819 /DNA_START=55 /DNA_END=1398 /DNA_ORIENTATION=+